VTASRPSFGGLTLLASLFALALALAAPAAQAAAPASAPPAATPTLVASPATMPWAEQFDMTSKISGRTYRIYVTKPPGPAPKAGYPVIYVLDGNANFGTAASQVVLRATTGGPRALVVGIGYPDANAAMVLRNRDLTPSVPTAAMLKAGAPPGPKENFGGADAFHAFMMQELRPRIAAAYPVNAADQTLMGYSLGGLFTLHVLFDHPEAYRTFVAGSPSIWWNDREVLAGEGRLAAAVKSGKVAPRILITSDAGEQDPKSPDVPASGPGRATALAAINTARMVDNARELAARLKALPGAKGYEVRYALFADETHVTGMPAATSRGVTFAQTP
jgi:ferri-bacillibactin esterase